jgi:hypothetical protein
MERQFVTTYTIRQTKIPTLLDSWVTNKHTSQNSVTTNKQPRVLNNVTCLTVSQSSIVKFLLSPLSVDYNKLPFLERFCDSSLRAQVAG